VHISVSRQFAEAAAALALGAAAGFLYDFLRVVRRRARAAAVTAVCDLLFCVLAGISLFLLGLTVGGGRQRLFMAAVAVLGVTLYFITVSRAALYVCDGIADILLLLLFFVSRPVFFFASVIKKTCIFLKKGFKYTQKWYIVGRSRRKSVKKRSINVPKSLEGDTNETETGRVRYENRRIRADCVRGGDAHQSARGDRRAARGAKRDQTGGHGKRGRQRGAGV
jgi:hypothetical protein